MMTKQIRNTVVMAALATSLAACMGMGDDGGSESVMAPEPAAQGQFTIEESDLYRYDGGLLYVQNPDTGLNIVDLTHPTKPRLLGQAPIVGKAGELYVRDGLAMVLLEASTSMCRIMAGCSAMSWSYGAELVMVDTTDPLSPRVKQRYCLPGELVDSRIVGDFLYAVTNQAAYGSQAISIDIRDPNQPKVVQQLRFRQASKEIHVTSEAIFVAGDGAVQPLLCTLESCTCNAYRCEPKPMTDLQYIEISPTTGQLKKRGSLKIVGEPQGRFHMSAFGSEFRIVTFETMGSGRSTRLTVVDRSNPDFMYVKGQLTGIGQGEQLYATRFSDDGKYAYVVTFRQTDPLWIIDLQDPTMPTIVGELFVPGWSDYIFPRGDTLLTVGRGDRGQGLGVSLFDLSDPTNPRVVDQITLGLGDTTSEANTDHRAVTILEPPGQMPMVVLPYTTYGYDSAGYSTCSRVNRLQLVDVNDAALRVRGMHQQNGLIRRTMMAGEVLISISDYEVVALDVRDRDTLKVFGSVVVGDEGSLAASNDYYCNWECGTVDEDYFGGWFCQMPTGSNAPPVDASIILILGVAYFVKRSRRRA